ncbi:MAG: DUF1311 domain-containing protein [Proteobacteria bacterium]|nr:DUF1311 domain-containing protein [Pseudomonadota bacterium]
MRVGRLILVVGALALSATTNAKTQSRTQPQTQAGMNRDAGARLKASERQMASQIATLDGRYTPAQRAALRRSQRAWLAYREADCAYQAAGARGGSAWPMLVADCKADRTETRVNDLKQQVECQEGDLACVKWAEHG